MSAASRKSDRLVVGGPPRADLLPPEIKMAKDARGQRRGLATIVALVFILVGVAYAFSTIAAASAQSQLDAANAETAQLLQEKASYSEVTRVQTQLSTVNAALRVGASTEVNWGRFIYELSLTFPAGSSMTNFSATSASPVAAYAAPTAPLQPPRMAEIVVTATVSDFTQIATMLDSFADIHGYTDAGALAVTSAEGGGYSVTYIIHIDTRALLNRYGDDPIDFDENPWALFGLDAPPAGFPVSDGSTTTETETDGDTTTDGTTTTDGKDTTDEQ